MYSHQYNHNATLLDRIKTCIPVCGAGNQWLEIVLGRRFGRCRLPWQYTGLVQDIQAHLVGKLVFLSRRDQYGRRCRYRFPYRKIKAPDGEANGKRVYMPKGDGQVVSAHLRERVLFGRESSGTGEMR